MNFGRFDRNKFNPFFRCMSFYEIKKDVMDYLGLKTFMKIV